MVGAALAEGGAVALLSPTRLGGLLQRLQRLSPPAAEKVVFLRPQTLALRGRARHVVRFGRVDTGLAESGRFEGVILDLEISDVSKPDRLTFDFEATAVRVPEQRKAEGESLLAPVSLVQRLRGRLSLSAEAPAAVVFGLQDPLQPAEAGPASELFLLFSCP